MKVDDIIELDISGQGMDGEGVARHEGVVVFVPFTLIGEKVRCKVTFVKKNFAQAKVIKVLVASPMRRTPPCKNYFRCGGCDYLHIVENAHKELKTQSAVNNFTKIAGVDIVVDEYIESSSFEGYRNKVQLPFGMVGDSVVVGYYRNKSHLIEPCDSCLLHPEWANNLSKIVVNWANTYKISVYNERLHQGLLRHLAMRKIGNKVAITLVINGKSVPDIDKLIDMIRASGMHFNLHYCVNRKDTNVIMGDELITMYGEECLQGEVLGVKVNVNPMAFMQINDEIRDMMYTKACNYLADCSRVIDLYSGIGITTNILATRCDNVYSIEQVQEAVDNANQLTVLNNNEYKITNICGDVSTELPKLLDKLRKIDIEQEQYNGGSDNSNVDNSNLSSVVAQSNTTDGVMDNSCPNELLTNGSNASDNNISNIDTQSQKECNQTNDTIYNELLIKGCNVDNNTSKIDTQSQNECNQTTDTIYNELLIKGCNVNNNISNIDTQSQKECNKNGASSFGVLIDPPRKGCDTAVIEAIKAARPDLIVYISCNHATLARDYAMLKDDYAITHFALYDMFPNTHHIESLVCLQRKK